MRTVACCERKIPERDSQQNAPRERNSGGAAINSRENACRPGWCTHVCLSAAISPTGVAASGVLGTYMYVYVRTYVCVYVCRVTRNTHDFSLISHIGSAHIFFASSRSAFGAGSGLALAQSWRPARARFEGKRRTAGSCGGRRRRWRRRPRWSRKSGVGR